MTRNELFDYIKANNLKEEVKAKFGKPYNSVATELLQDFVESLDLTKNATITYKDSKSLSYKDIKVNDLQNFVKELYGKNYTNLSTEELRNVYDRSHNRVVSIETTEDKCNNNVTDCTETVVVKVLKALCTILNQKDLLKLLN